MSFELLVGPPNSGKSSRLLERALQLARDGKRVWWVGLPNQRGHVYRLATAAGAVAGLEFLTLQQFYYRLLAHANRLQPLLAGTGRLALTGEALARDLRAFPTPGEARLFAQAIAEAKRNGLPPARFGSDDPEIARLGRVYASYEEIKGPAWDYDDFRLQALELARAGEARLEAAALFIDGFREIGPLELQLFRRLGDDAEVHLALAQEPPGAQATRLPARPAPAAQLYEAPNPVRQVRWTLAALKRDLAQGFAPTELALLVPVGGGDEFLALADEYGVPLADERPRSLADSGPGRLLVQLVELPLAPTASRLAALPELRPLANAALEHNIAGEKALSRLAASLGLAEAFRSWLSKLVPTGQPLEWAGETIGLALDLAQVTEEDERRGFAANALQRAREALRVAPGEGFAEWWVALLHEATQPARRELAIPLLDERLVSGRRFRKLYLTGATQGAYGLAQHEDYFVPEEQRQPPAALFERFGELLPERLTGGRELILHELRTRAQQLIITYPSADQGGSLTLDTQLCAGLEPQPLPPLPAASPLELGPGERFGNPFRATGLLAGEELPDVEGLNGFSTCSLRYWYGTVLTPPRPPEGQARWRQLRRGLVESGRLTGVRLAQLSGEFPEAAAWLSRHEELLLSLTFGVVVSGGDGLQARLDAAVTRDGEAHIYYLAAPGQASTPDEAQQLLKDRWSEWWAVDALLARYGPRLSRARLYVWPFLLQPIPLGEAVDGKHWLVRRTVQAVAQARGEFHGATIEATPGYYCRSCPFLDACRVGLSA